jgi:phage tail-like protein
MNHSDAKTSWSVPAIYFKVTIDKSNDLGGFSSCSGLGCSVETVKHQEGGNNGFVWQLPTHITYTNITLSRPVCRDSAKLTDWIASFAANVTRCTASIEALNPDGETVATWNLNGVIPVRWTGPKLDQESPKVATESIELAHHGFLPGRNFRNA